MIRRASTLVLALALSGCTGGGTDPDDRPAEPAGETITAPGVQEEVRLTAPAVEGAGEVPTFEWAPVGGAASYRLVVLDAKDQPVWAWEGPETSIRLGELSVDRPEGEAGPVITPGSSWSVVALDTEGHVVAVSRLRPVAP